MAYRGWYAIKSKQPTFTDVNYRKLLTSNIAA